MTAASVSFMWYKNVGTSFFRFVTKHAFDRRTDKQTDRKALAIPCVALHAIYFSDNRFGTKHFRRRRLPSPSYLLTVPFVEFLLLGCHLQR